ncbi:DUF4351 domain-containing protein [Leptothermofonsia sichuanensis E412]|uniref:DUF4351 domain-containing protein n=1 Tax=Leptothermofonsia sichuanensis TaxID=2917832 RepID=UPI001CA5FB79|nr:DUF4351 domain-containing protein [Leptothermofonsia sichuanensis]QZZ23606.1 DUF4351 domain-containing protein [Leptothermofonsia sichuanensis E412]
MQLLTRRFGQLEADLQARIQVLSREELEVLGEALLDFSQITDLDRWLEQRDRL